MSGVCGVADEDRKMLVFLAFSAIGENNDSDIDVEDTLDISSSSSSSEDELVNIILVLNKKRGKLEVRPRIQHYVEETIPRFSDHEFKSHFRNSVSISISKANSVAGRKPIPNQTQLLLTLWVMTTQDSYRSICDRFNVGKATAIRSVQRVTYALYCLAPRFIQWPTGD
ncbi:hypothetical protein PV326_001543 [Microctonus aethiopoides]|nr:hypothetical protein PV326_001543 [Microctonus aethiopoides]